MAVRDSNRPEDQAKYRPLVETYWELQGLPQPMSIDELRTCLLSFIKLIDTGKLNNVSSDYQYLQVLQNTTEPVRDMARRLGLRKAYKMSDPYEKMMWRSAWTDWSIKAFY